jgi:hypothetical protein
MSKNANGSYYQSLHVLDTRQVWSRAAAPTIIHATFRNATSQMTFDPAQYKERAICCYFMA